ncbi:c-type cytochrome [Ottowia testudinis]|uniref:C-type cytochrome n=1 Tax=Ottowia testudinis TaxID=2816950 RepID=A0A975H3C1_9BURK|nr:c-type cytochrome [Ottowia testudinis]QTD45076.1 c-type cytochrome [Ottowia testudinis]
MRRALFNPFFLALAALLAPALCYAQGDSALRTRLRQVEADPALSAAALKAGAKTAEFCANCHGRNGQSLTADTPHLAAQLPAYMLTQMQLFIEGRRRHEFMQGLLKAMSVDEKVNVALYFSRQPLAAQASSDPTHMELAAHGKRYYDQICFRCHGAQGRGADQVPRIAGQQEAYMKLTLKRYRDGSAVRADPMMAESTRLMSDADIDAVAAHVAGMK